MTARDRFTSELKCPVCGKTGIAELSQEDGWSFSNGDQSTRIDFLPEGFFVVSKGDRFGQPDFHCTEHRVSARGF